MSAPTVAGNLHSSAKGEVKKVRVFSSRFCALKQEKECIHFRFHCFDEHSFKTTFSKGDDVQILINSDSCTRPQRL